MNSAPNCISSRLLPFSLLGRRDLQVLLRLLLSKHPALLLASIEDGLLSSRPRPSLAFSESLIASILLFAGSRCFLRCLHLASVGWSSASCGSSLVSAPLQLSSWTRSPTTATVRSGPYSAIVFATAGCSKLRRAPRMQANDFFLLVVVADALDGDLVQCRRPRRSFHRTSGARAGSTRCTCRSTGFLALLPSLHSVGHCAVGTDPRRSLGFWQLAYVPSEERVDFVPPTLAALLVCAVPAQGCSCLVYRTLEPCLGTRHVNLVCSSSRLFACLASLRALADHTCVSLSGW